MNCGFNCGSACNRCKNFVKTIDVKGTETELVLAIPARALCNKSTLCICIAQPIPDIIGENSALKILVGDDEYLVGTICGNFIYGDQLRTGKVYCFKFGTDTLAFIYRGGWRLCPTKHAFTCIPLPIPPVKVSSPKPRTIKPNTPEKREGK